MTATSLVAHLLLFASVGFLFLFVSLLFGRFLRARASTPEELQPSECGEPPAGSSPLPLNLRLYVVALVLIMFEVEVAFFFPSATVFGVATQLMNPNSLKVVEDDSGRQSSRLGRWAEDQFGKLGVIDPQPPAPLSDVEKNTELIETNARHLAGASMVEISVFFAVVLMGFAYVWYRGDLNWFRGVGHAPSMADGPGRQLAPGPHTD
jgi:NADH-quinone oxidoreductase subunit A